MWEELGFNYNYQGAGANYLVDLPVILSKGGKNLRLLIVDYTDNTATGIPLWKTILQYALNLTDPTTGDRFERITIGLTSNPTTLTNGNKANYLAAALTFADYLEGLNDARIVYCIGNEEMYHRDGSLTDAQVRSFMRDVYNGVTARYTVGPITYSMANGEMFPYYNDFSGSALAYPWDFASANLYSYPHGSTTSGTYFSINLSSATSWFGSTFEVSEFSPDPSGYSDAAWYDKDFYADQFIDNLHDIIDHNIPRAYVYNFMDADFGCKSPNGTFRAWWYLMIGEQIPYNVGMI